MHRPFRSKRISSSKHIQFIGQYQNCRQLPSNETLIQAFTQHSTNSISELNLKIPKPQLPLGSHPFVLSRHFTHLAPKKLCLYANINRRTFLNRVNTLDAPVHERGYHGHPLSDYKTKSLHAKDSVFWMWIQLSSWRNNFCIKFIAWNLVQKQFF